MGAAPQMDMGFPFKGGVPPQQQQYQQQPQQYQQPPPPSQANPYGPGAQRGSAGVGMGGVGAPPAPAQGAAAQEPDPDDDPNRLPTFVKVRGLPAEHDPRIVRRPGKKKVRRNAGCCA